MHNTAQERRTPDYVLARNVPVTSSYLEENKRYKVVDHEFAPLLEINPESGVGLCKIITYNCAHLAGGDWTRGYIYYV